MTSGETSSSPNARSEALRTWGLSVLLTFAVAALATVIPLLQANLAAVFAAVFLFLPGRVLPRSGPGIEAYGWARDGWAAGLRLGLIVSVLTIAAFLPGYHLWLTQVQPRVVEVATDRSATAWQLDVQDGAYRRLPLRAWGRPAAEEPGRVYVYYEGDRIFVQWRPTEAPWRIEVASDGTIIRNRQLAAASSDPWRVEGRAPRRVNLSFATRDATELTILATQGESALSPEQFALGGSARPVEPRQESERGGTRLPLTPVWFVHLALTHLLLIALPEEFFYRGYLQKRLGEASAPRTWIRLGPLSITNINVLVSVLFALGHLVAEPSPGRLAVFFPSLLFGALRDRTDGIWASVVFHAACNLMVQAAAMHYF